MRALNALTMLCAETSVAMMRGRAIGRLLNRFIAGVRSGNTIRETQPAKIRTDSYEWAAAHKTIARFAVFVALDCNIVRLLC